MVLNHIRVGAHQCVFYTCGAPSGAWTFSLPALPIFQCCLPFSALACGFPTNCAHVRTPSLSLPSLLRFFLWFAHPRAPTVDPCWRDSLFRLCIEDHTENYPKTQANLRGTLPQNMGRIHVVHFSLPHLSSISPWILTNRLMKDEAASSFYAAQKPCYFTKARFCC
jgi:hypothetical protein